MCDFFGVRPMFVARMMPSVPILVNEGRDKKETEQK
jgi:hypothetical protein